MTDQRQGTGRHNEIEYRSKPPRVPRGPTRMENVSSRAQWLALLLIALAVVWWFLNY